jgi:hypothetical protein
MFWEDSYIYIKILNKRTIRSKRCYYLEHSYGNGGRSADKSISEPSGVAISFPHSHINPLNI